MPDERYLEGDLDILRRCDGVVMTPDWQYSQGASAEYKFAKDLVMPVWVYPVIPPKGFCDEDRYQLSKAMRRDPDTGAIALCALRYCMGRKTYMPSVVINWVKRHWNQFPEQDKTIIAKEVCKELREHPENLGSACDLKTWQDFGAWLEIPF